MNSNQTPMGAPRAAPHRALAEAGTFPHNRRFMRDAAPGPRTGGPLLVIIYLGFVSLGLPDGTLGVAWPAAYPELGLPLSLAGVLTTVATLLTAVSGFSSGWVMGRWRTGPVVLVSCLLTATALLLISRAQGAAALFLAMIPLGLGAGAVDAGLNGFVARHYSGRHMNWLHACWGVGATVGPLLVGRSLGTEHGWRGGYLLLSTLQFALAGLFLLTLGRWRAVPERTLENSHASARSPRRTPTMPASSAAGWVAPGIFALYVAAEMTVGLWAGTLLVVQRGFAPTTAGLCAAGYYAAITGGRVAVGFAVERWGNRPLVWAGVVLALGGLLALGAGGPPWLAAAALVATGAGFAPIYPCLMHEVPRRFEPAAVQRVIGRQSGAASLGAATVPALAGWIAQSAVGGVVWLALAVTAAMAGAIGWLDRRT